MTYKTGYRRPPKSGQFKKGDSGNPKGRPKGSKNFLTLVEHELNRPVTVTDGGRRKTMSSQQFIVKRLIAAALQSDPKALFTLLELMRRTGKFDQAETQNQVPLDYASLLKDYIDRQLKTRTINPPKKGD